MSKKEAKITEKKTTKKTENIIPEEFKRIEELENLVEKSEQEKKISFEKISAEKKELEDKILRLNADLQNMKRRSDADRGKARVDGAVKTLMPFIEVIDNFSRAFDHLPENLVENEFIIGLQGIEKKFSESLDGLQVQFFGDIGEDFNADLHESVMIAPESEKGKIGQVFEKGVQLGEKIIRHAKVSVGA